ncbi:hypothetical protein A8926_4987 [Saccharopolyspora spinosa]|uniref:Uncharacterized protein n=1 Tax=Saccharopolyspora spinosa TaxID=60894 RepID=A0A2N3Y2D7_SACSN|nr:hypothetical protein A8926_4987 [Saccharopolyspora spinosa]
MNERSWERAGAVRGLVAAVLLLVSVLLNPTPPASDEAVLTFFYVAAHRSTVLLAALLMTVAAVVFLWFVGRLHHREQLCGAVGGQFVGRCNGACQRVAGGLGDRCWSRRRNRVPGQLGTVDGSSDAARDRHADGYAQFVAGLGRTGSRSRTLRWGAADDQVVGQHLRRVHREVEQPEPSDREPGAGGTGRGDDHQSHHPQRQRS